MLNPIIISAIVIIMNCEHSSELTELKNKIESIERKVDLILFKMDENIIKSCDKMENHINFVNGVYTTVKVPLNYISNKIHKIINPLGFHHKELPLINDGIDGIDGINEIDGIN